MGREASVRRVIAECLHEAELDEVIVLIRK